MEEIEMLEELRETNKRQAKLNYDRLIGDKVAEATRAHMTQAEREAAEDEDEIRWVAFHHHMG